MRVLVTGGTGFVGYHAARTLAKLSATTALHEVRNRVGHARVRKQGEVVCVGQLEQRGLRKATRSDA